MAEERADALVQLRADDVFKFAGLRMRLGILDGKCVLEETLGQAVAADDAARALATHGSELYFAVFHLYQVEIRHARENSCGRLSCDGREVPSRPRGVEELGPCRLPFLAANPYFFEQMVEAAFVVGRNGSAAVRRVRQWAVEWMAGAMLQRIEMQRAVGNLAAPVRLPPQSGIPRHPHTGGTCRPPPPC